MKMKKLTFGMTVLFAMLSVLMTGCSSSETLDYKNATYVIDGESITLKEGVYQSKSEGNVTTVALDSLLASGDVDGDGKEDKVVSLSADYGGSGTFYYVGVVLSPDTKLTADSYFVADRIKIKSATVDNQQIVVNYLDRPANAPMSEDPTVEKEVKLTLKDGKLQ